MFRLAATACRTGRAQAQTAAPSCRFICELEWKFEPTLRLNTWRTVIVS